MNRKGTKTNSQKWIESLHTYDTTAIIQFIHPADKIAPGRFSFSRKFLSDETDVGDIESVENYCHRSKCETGSVETPTLPRCSRHKMSSPAPNTMTLYRIRVAVFPSNLTAPLLRQSIPVDPVLWNIAVKK